MLNENGCHLYKTMFVIVSLIKVEPKYVIEKN